MASGGITLYTINDVINIDNTTKNISVGTNPLKTFKNLNDTNISDVFRVTDGIWVDRITVTDIKAHSCNVDHNDNITQGTINIGEDGNDINVKGKFINIASADDDSTIVINGSNLTIGQSASTSTLLGTTTQIGTKNANLDGASSSETSIYGNVITLNEYDTLGTSTIYGKTIDICDSNIANSITNINGKTLNIAEDASTVVMKGITTTIATSNIAGTTSIYGSNLNIGEDCSTLIIKATDTTIATAGQENTITTINGKTINIAEDESTVVMKGITTTIATSNIAGTTSIYGSNLNIGEDCSTLIIKATDTTIATAGQENTITTINGKTINIAEETSTVVVNGSNTTIGSADITSETKINGKEVNLGESINTTNLYIHGQEVVIGSASTNLKLTGSTFELNSSSDAGYIKVNETDSTIEIGSADTATLNVKATTIDTTATIYKINDANSKTNFELNDTESKITIGGPELNETTLHGSNIFIGKGGGNVTIYGNLVQYSEGSNVTIVTNTVTQETAAFLVHNTGTKTAFTVIQDNQVSSDGENLVEFYTESNQDRIPFRVDHVGRVGLGVSSSCNLQAWLHVNRNDPDIEETSPADLLLVEDIDNDSTPFIIKKTGEIGIGTSIPEYKLDVCSSDSDVKKGIALRDVVYIKQHDTSRIIFGAGNVLYDHSANITHYATGFKFTYNNTPVVAALADDTYIFRMTCKMHIAGDNGNIAFRKFEAFINPKQTLSELTLLTDTIDAVHRHYEFQSPTIMLDGSTSAWTLRIPWNLRDQSDHSSLSTSNYPDASRVYLDVEFFGSSDIGDISAEPQHFTSTDDGTTYTTF